MADSSAPTRVMMAVNESSLKGGYCMTGVILVLCFHELTWRYIVVSLQQLVLLIPMEWPDEGFDDMDSIYASPTDFQSMKQRDRIRGIHLLEYFVNECHRLGIKCEAWTKQGDPKEVICHEVKRVQPDLLVVGSRGLGPFQRVFVGTVSEFCVKHAECPVITIKRKANEAPQDPIDD
ncbi:Universal stress protein A-like protein [Triticum urartu]|uniref:UspA domain-containing protein n=2 Tax=Triticum TaxID=4564 RepID=A0A9R1B211_TRITD|nr:Universal stress protein A-like protein [Triticum urartu]VAI48524.1 unnamed protein product [Triticum turgidum subsp. durum]